eukprot:scaffold80696_cov23-Tisochrysis_lutea.AAC.1
MCVHNAQELALPIIENEIFGEVAEAKEVAQFAMNYKEAKKVGGGGQSMVIGARQSGHKKGDGSHRSGQANGMGMVRGYESFMLLAAGVTFKTSMEPLLDLVRWGPPAPSQQPLCAQQAVTAAAARGARCTCQPHCRTNSAGSVGAQSTGRGPGEGGGCAGACKSRCAGAPCVHVCVELNTSYVCMNGSRDVHLSSFVAHVYSMSWCPVS